MRNILLYCREWTGECGENSCLEPQINPLLIKLDNFDKIALN